MNQFIRGFTLFMAMTAFVLLYLDVCLFVLLAVSTCKKAVALQLQHIKTKGTCSVLPGLHNGARAAAASPCIIQHQAHLDRCMLVIPLVGLSLLSPWQLFPLP